MPSRIVIKRDSDGRPTEGGLRLPGPEKSVNPDQPAKSGLRQTCEGRITKPSNPVGNKKRHGKASLLKVPESKGHRLRELRPKKSDEGSLHDMSSLDKSLAQEAMLEAHKNLISEPSIEPNSSEPSSFGPNDPSRNRWSKEFYQNKAYDDAQSNADAAPTTTQSTYIPDSVKSGITNGHSNSTDASIPGIHAEKHGVSQCSHHGDSAPPDTGTISSTGPAAPVGL